MFSSVAGRTAGRWPGILQTGLSLTIQCPAIVVAEREAQEIEADIPLIPE
jgi:hypothetical protein